MPETGPKREEQLHDAVVKKAAETIFKKYKVVMNIAGNKVASIGEVFPDLLAYEVFSVKPFLASEIPALIGMVETESVISQKLLDKWAKLEDLDVDKIVLILPVEMRDQADVLLRDLGPKFELHFFDNELHIS
ncbi:MAG: hypothetical protein LUP95_04065 [Euryarchaeota archaeon]|nr:hypothetical protein [Euryarchaeota archaeon]